MSDQSLALATYPRPVGRPSQYDPEYAIRVRDYCILGAKDTDLARIFGVSVVTIHAWMNAHPEFLKSVKEGRLEADAQIASSLYHRAKGYSHDAVKIFMPAGSSEPVYAPYKEHYPPDTAAAFIWLKNRQPELWRDYKSVDVKVQHEHNISEQTQEFLSSMLAALAEDDSTLLDASATVIEDKSTK